MNGRTAHHEHKMPFGAELRADGTAFRLWAPSQPRAAVIVDGAERAMEPRAGGWFEREVPGVPAGARYQFAFPGIDLRVPDPASRFQPDGVHGPSEVIDPRAYAWHDAAWHGRPWHETVLYELHVGTFTPEGTYAAAAQRLDDLVQLGVTAVELMPLAQPAGARNWGYDGVLPFAPQYDYGTPAGLKAFVDAAHAHGISVFLDVVFNHFGPEGNYLHAYAKPVFTERHHTPWGAAINVDGEQADTVRELFVQNALYWLREYRFDGLRLDAVHEIRDDSRRPFLEELAARVRAGVEPGRQVHLVLENDANDARLLGHYDAQWNDDAHHAFHVLLTGETDGYYGDYAQAPARLLGARARRRLRVPGRIVGAPRRRAARDAERVADDDRVRRLPAEPRPDRQPRVRRAHLDARARRRACARRPRCCCSRPRSRCCSWARNGRPRRRSCSSPTSAPSSRKR